MNGCRGYWSGASPPPEAAWRRIERGKHRIPTRQPSPIIESPTSDAARWLGADHVLRSSASIRRCRQRRRAGRNRDNDEAVRLTCRRNRRGAWRTKVFQSPSKFQHLLAVPGNSCSLESNVVARDNESNTRRPKTRSARWPSTPRQNRRIRYKNRDTRCSRRSGMKPVTNARRRQMLLDGSGPRAMPHRVCASLRNEAFLRRDPRPRTEVGVAERKGFEPLIQLSPYGALAKRCLQPLGHLSGGADMPEWALSRKRQIQIATR